MARKDYTRSFDPPDPYAPPSQGGDARPAVITWFRVYAAVLSLLFLALLGVLGFLVYARTQTKVYGDTGGFDAFLPIFTVLTFGMLVLYVVSIFVPMKPWGWTLGLVAIVLGLSSIWIVVAIPLLLKWLDPRTKAAFGRL